MTAPSSMNKSDAKNPLRRKQNDKLEKKTYKTEPVLIAFDFSEFVMSW